MAQFENDLFLRVCKRLPVDRTPVWIMRQAGRYLPEYRAIREKVDFLTLCKTPELAAEVTIQPVDILGVDAAIIFSDILVLPEAKGMKLTIKENTGPVFEHPVRNEDDAAHLHSIEPEHDLQFVLDAVSCARRELNSRVPLIGFSGSPWTLLTYMVEGGSSKNFMHVKSLLFNNPRLAHTLLAQLANEVSDYLNAQIEAGADAVQIFDSWGGVLTPKDYIEFSFSYITEIISALKRTGKPVIVFSKGVHHSFERLASSGADVIGIDWTVDIGEVRKVVGDRVALQGNLDPCILYADKSRIKEEVKRILDSYAQTGMSLPPGSRNQHIRSNKPIETSGRPAAESGMSQTGSGDRHIFNLGHGILPDTDPEHAKALVQFVKEESIRYHSPVPVKGA